MSKYDAQDYQKFFDKQKEYNELADKEDEAFQKLLGKVKGLPLDEVLLILQSEDDPIMNDFRDAQNNASNYYSKWVNSS